MGSALLRPAMIALPLVLGAFFPQASNWSFLVRWVLVGMVFFVCLQLELRDLKPLKCHWYLLGANLAIGVAGFLIFLVFGYRELALAAFFTGITPTATAAPVVMHFLHGRVGFVVSGLVVTTVGVSLALLALMPLVTGNISFGFVGSVLTNLLIIIVLPFFAASAVRRLYPGAAAWPKRFRMLSLSAWSFMLFIISARAAEFLRCSPDVPAAVVFSIAASAAAICAVNFTVGALIVPKRYRREGSQTLGQKNNMFTIYLAMTFASPLAALGPTFYVVFHNLWNVWQIFVFDRRRAGASRSRR